ncbi:MAG: hypothetical protein AB7F35_04760 [Acetobacteraceae bacterium]
MIAMSSVGAGAGACKTVLLPFTAAIAGAALLCLPATIITVLAMWFLVSIPVGVIAGHCVLSEK